MAVRQGFNFYRSYFDVYKELPDSDKVAFMDALLNRQFNGIEPGPIKGMAKFAYISQKFNIDRQVKGFEDKTRERITPCYGGLTTPTEQEKVKEKVKEKEQGKGKEEDLPHIPILLESSSFDKLDPNNKQNETDFKNKIECYPNKTNLRLGLIAFCKKPRDIRELVIDYLQKYSLWWQAQKNAPFAPQIHNVIENETYLDPVPEVKIADYLKKDFKPAF